MSNPYQLSQHRALGGVLMDCEGVAVSPGWVALGALSAPVYAVPMSSTEFSACFHQGDPRVLSGRGTLSNMTPSREFAYAPDSEKSCPLERAVIKWRDAVSE